MAPVAALARAALPGVAAAEVAPAAVSARIDSEMLLELLHGPPSAAGASRAAPERGKTPGRFTGTLDDFCVADLVQILELAQKDAIIHVSHAGLESRLWCSAGLIVDAESGRLRGEAALHRILGLERGSLLADLRAEPRERTIFAATPHLLLEAARRKDESAELRRQLGDELRCYRVGALAAADPAGMNLVELSLLQGFSTLQTLRDAVDSSPFGELETLTALLRCIRAGYLLDSGASGSKRPTPASDGRPSDARPSHTSTTQQVHARRPWLSGSVLWLAAALTATALLPAGYLVGRSAALLLAAPAPTIAPVPLARQEASNQLRAEVLELRVEPPQAQVSLDSGEPRVGHLQTAWTRDGTLHELRVSAPGFIPARVLFADAAPPSEIRLEPLPTDACSAVVRSPVPRLDSER